MSTPHCPESAQLFANTTITSLTFQNSKKKPKTQVKQEKETNHTHQLHIGRQTHASVQKRAEGAKD